jgi:hypothetical protein
MGAPFGTAGSEATYGQQRRRHPDRQGADVLSGGAAADTPWRSPRPHASDVASDFLKAALVIGGDWALNLPQMPEFGVPKLE